MSEKPHVEEKLANVLSEGARIRFHGRTRLVAQIVALPCADTLMLWLRNEADGTLMPMYFQKSQVLFAVMQ